MNKTVYKDGEALTKPIYLSSAHTAYAILLGLAPESDWSFKEVEIHIDDSKPTGMPQPPKQGDL